MELVDGTGQLLARRPIDAVPCTIGSARDNTIVVDGEDVAPYHARIDANPDGSLSITALGVHPGLQRPGAPERQPSLLLTLTAPVGIGKGILRLVDAAAAPVPDAMAPAAPPTGWRARIAQRPLQCGVAIVGFLAAAAYSWFTVPTDDRGMTAVVLGGSFLLVVAIWAGFWALVDRMRHGARRFGSHFTVAGIGTIVSLLASELVSWQQFLSPSSTAVAGLLLFITTTVGGLALYAQFRVMGPRNREKHLRWAAGLTAGLLLLSLLVGRLDTDWSNRVTFTGVLKPWPVSLTPAWSAERYGESLGKLEKALESDSTRTQPVIGD
jgi:hypothetical protein